MTLDELKSLLWGAAVLLRGKINNFGLDSLVNMAVAAGLHVEMRVKEAA